MTTSGRTPRRNSSGKISAALPSRPTEIGSRPALVQRSIIASASSSVVGLRVEIAGAQAQLDAARLAFDGEAARRRP